MRSTLFRRARMLAIGVLAVAATTATQTVALAAPAAASNQLTTGASIASGQSLYSPNGAYRLTMQSDGNLVLYTDTGYPMWDSGTWGRGASKLVLQADGNLVVYTAAGAATWSSDTWGGDSDKMLLQDDGTFVLSSPSRRTWCSCSMPFARVLGGPTQLTAGTGLFTGDALRSGSTSLIMQADGNLVLYGGSTALWWSGTRGSNLRATLQTDGNFVVYDPARRPLWDSGTWGSGASVLRIGTDGGLRVATGNGALVWAAGAARPASIAGDVLGLLNRQRAANGLPALASEPRLTAAAFAHNRAMSNANTMSHQLPGEPDLGTRISATGYAWRMLAENVGWSTDLTTNGAQTMQSAMYNEVAPNNGHRLNILSTAVTQVGVDVLVDGRGKLWLTTDFGQPR